jgi:hypothetical protein
MIIQAYGGFVIYDAWDRSFCGRDGYWARFKQNAMPFRTVADAERFINRR